jgi:hypothetical protein
VSIEVFVEVSKSTLEGLRGAGRQSAKGVTRGQKLGLKHKLFEIARLATPSLYRVQNAFNPCQAAPARRAPATRFLSEEMFEIPQHPDRTGLIIQHNHGASTHSASCFLNLGEIHGHIQVLFNKKVRRRTARKQAPQAKPIAHATGVLFEDFPYGSAHRKLPQTGPLHLSANAVQFCAAVLTAA